MNTKLRRLSVGAAVGLLATAVTPHIAAAAPTTIQLFPAHNVVANAAPGTFDQKSVILICNARSLTIIDSPGSATGLITDNFLTESATRAAGRTVIPTKSLCTEGNGAAPSGGSCFSSANDKAFVTGSTANEAYQGIGTVTVPTVPGLAIYTFRLVNGGNSANPEASNALRLRTSCLARALDQSSGSAARR